MSNPYLRWMSKEDVLQHSVILWLKYQHPALRYHHSPDSGKRTPFEQFKYKYLGCDAGWPDLVFPSLNLAVELKCKGNKPTPAQKGWLADLESFGWQTAVCYSLEEVQEVINANLKSKAA